MVSCVVFLFEPSSPRVDHAERTVCMDFSTEERCLFGVPFSWSTMGEVLEICRRVVEGGEKLTIGVANAAKIVKMRRDRELRDSVVHSDLVLADGASIVWASWLLRR